MGRTDGSEGPSENPVSSARTRIRTMCDTLDISTNAARQVADTMFGSEGPRSSNGADGPTDPPRMGEAGLLHSDLDTLWEKFCELDHQIRRLDPLASCPGTTRAMQSDTGLARGR